MCESVFLACKAKEAAARAAEKVCSIWLLLPVCFSLCRPSNAGRGQWVSLSPRGPGAVGTSKLLVTTSSGIQLNSTPAHTQKHTERYPNAQKPNHTFTLMRGWILWLFIYRRGLDSWLNNSVVVSLHKFCACAPTMCANTMCQHVFIIRLNTWICVSGDRQGQKDEHGRIYFAWCTVNVWIHLSFNWRAKWWSGTQELLCHFW